MSLAIKIIICGYFNRCNVKICLSGLFYFEINCIFAEIKTLSIMRKIYYIIFALGFMSMPVVAHADSAIEIIETDYDGQKGGISLRVISDGNGQTRLRITNANGQTLSIYDVSGAPVKRIKVDGVDKTYELNLRKGCYIVKVGNVVRKVSVS